MAGNVKGITIEFRGDTSKLSKALSTVRKEARDFDKELGYIDNSLKFNPGNVELIQQKMTVLKQAADKAEDNVKDLKAALDKMKSEGVDETSADYRELEREIVRAESKQKSYNAELKKMEAASSKIGQLSEKFKNFGSKVEAAGQALIPLSTAGAAVDVAIGTLAFKSGKAADELNTLSKQTGISTSTLQKYSAAADLVDVPLETMVNSQTKLTKSMAQAQDGAKKQTKAFDKLGIAVTDSNGELRDSNVVFDEVITALGKIENPTERAATAQKIFGNNAKELNSLIADGGETYQKVAKIYEDNDLSIVDQETLDNANKFNDAIDTIKLTAAAALSKVGTTLAASLAPALEKAVEWVSKLAGWFSKLSPTTLKVIAVIAGVVAGLAPLLIVVGKVATGISAVMSLISTVGPMLAGLAGPIGIAVLVIGGLVAAGIALYKNWDTIKAKVQELLTALKEKWEAIKKAVSEKVEALKTAVKTKFDAIKEAVKTKIDSLKESIKTKWESIKESVKTKVDLMKESVKAKIDAMKESVKAKIDALKESIKAKWDSIKESVKTKVDSMKESVKTKIESMKESVKNKIESMKESIKNKVDSMKESVKNKIDTMKESVKSKIEALKDSVKAKFDAIKEKMLSPIESAKEKIKSAIDKIKSIISGAKLQLPHFKLPHFKIDGGELPWGIGGQGKAPSISVDWYKEGGIFNRPSLIGVGEAGAEAVLPIEKLKDWMQEMNGGITINVYASEGMNVNELAIEIERRLAMMQKRRAGAWA